jgi:hypothetical protein
MSVAFDELPFAMTIGVLAFNGEFSSPKLCTG